MPNPSEFELRSREDREYALFQDVLRRFRDVRPAAAPVMTTRGLRVKKFTAECPADPAHRIAIRQTDGGALYTCAHCAATAPGMDRLGSALELLTGYTRSGNAFR